jgi:hypothetical protein
MDIERAKIALKNAHAAGDVESARKIAIFLKQNQGSKTIDQPIKKAKDEGYISKEQTLAERGRTAFDQSMQGATFGFADEIFDRIGALIASQYTGLPYADLLKEARGTTKTRLEEQIKEMPVTSVASNIAGGLVTGVGAGATKGGAAVSNWLRSGNLAVQAGKGAVAGAASGALYGAGSNEENRLEGAGYGAILGGAAGGAAPVLANAPSAIVKGTKTLAQGVAARGADLLDDAAVELKQQGNKIYKQFKDTGAVLNNKRAKNIINNVEKAIQESGKLNARLHGDTLSVLDDLKVAQKSNPLGLEELDQYRQLFSDVINKNTDPIKGANPDAFKANQAIETIDRMVNKLKPIDIIGGDDSAIKLLNDARSQWKKFKKFQSVANIVKRADGDPNKLKTSLKNFIDKPKNLRGYTEAEKQALKLASKNSMTENIFKQLGRFGIEPNNVFLPLVSGGLGTLSGFAGPTGALVATGTVTRQLNKLIGKAKAEQVLKLIEAGGNKQAIKKAINSASPQIKKQAYTTLGITTGNVATTPIK